MPELQDITIKDLDDEVKEEFLRILRDRLSSKATVLRPSDPSNPDPDTPPGAECKEYVCSGNKLHGHIGGGWLGE